MKHLVQSMALAAFLSVGLISCEDNETPQITIHELGYENTKTVIVGSELHIDAEILAPQKISNIQLIIHSENGHADAPAQLSTMNIGTWEVDSIYTKSYAGVKNTDFHEHIDVPASAALGHYHVHIKVTDMAGNQTIKEDEIEVLAAK